jgi:hypothetical protein
MFTSLVNFDIQVIFLYLVRREIDVSEPRVIKKKIDPSN